MRQSLYILLFVVLSASACHQQKPGGDGEPAQSATSGEKQQGESAQPTFVPAPVEPAEEAQEKVQRPAAESPDPVAENRPKEVLKAVELQLEEKAEETEERSKRMVSDKTVVGILGADFGSKDSGIADLAGGAESKGRDSMAFGEGKMDLDGLAGPGGADGAPRAGLALKPEKKKPAEQQKPVKTWKRSTAIPNTSSLKIGDNEELPLKGMQIKTDIQGYRARVLIDFYFFNDRHQQYEGTFKLRLPGGASPYFFAFGETASRRPALALGEPVFDEAGRVRSMGFAPAQIMQDRKEDWLQPKEARMVPKEKAAFAYRETVRRRVDPALMEWSGAGVFSSRVFPIAPQKMYRIVIGYDVDLTQAGEDLEYRLDVPEKVQKLAVNIGVASLEGVTPTAAPEVFPLNIDGTHHFRYEDPKAQSIIVRLPAPGVVALAREQPKIGDLFASRFTPKLDESAAAGMDAGVFLVDASLTSNPDQFNVWLALVKEILTSNRTSMTRFSVCFFNIEAFWWKQGFVENTEDNVQQLLAYAHTLALEGATDLSAALSEGSNPRWHNPNTHPAKWDTFLLSDGGITWGQSSLHALTNPVKKGARGSIFAYKSGFQGTDTRVLEHIARESGGAVFSVVGEAEVASAAVAHRHRPWVIEEVLVPGATDLLLGGRPRSLFPGQTVTLAGRGIPERGLKMTLRLRQGATVKEFSTAINQVLDTELAPRAYGQTAVGQLEEFEAETEEVSQAYARHFRVTGQTCSLLMLESEADYLRFDIKPEEDQFVVKTNPASVVVKEVLAALQDTLGDPAKAFTAWLAKLEEMKFVNFAAGTAFKMALKRLPSKAFRVEPKPLLCKSHGKEGIAKVVLDQLASRKLDYDVMLSEAHRRAQQLEPADALKALSSMVENSPGDTVLARDVGFSAMQWGLGGQAYYLFRRVAESRPFEPQTYRALALALADMGKTDLAAAYYEIALGGNWDSRFGEFKKIVGLDYLRFLRKVKKGVLKSEMADFLDARLDTVARDYDVGSPDILISITWNTDGTDVDLHIIEPTGEECYYSNRTTRIGGSMTQDVTQGYGPEMYMLHKAKPGKYRVRVKYFSSDFNRASARTKVYATVYQGWGTPDEKVTRKVVTLMDNKEMHDIITVNVK